MAGLSVCLPGVPLLYRRVQENVIKEAEYQIKRLRHHPSLALWCGNNEIEQMTPAWMHRVKYVKWTKKYFYDILPPIVEKNDGVTPYIPARLTARRFEGYGG